MNETAEMLAIAAASATVIAFIAWVGDRRRMRRKNLDNVGFMPWTPLFFWSLMAAIIVAGLAVQAALAG